MCHKKRQISHAEIFSSEFTTTASVQTSSSPTKLKWGPQLDQWVVFLFCDESVQKWIALRSAQLCQQTKSDSCEQFPKGSYVVCE
jgi:hypothetical protein